MAETRFDDWIARRYSSLWPELYEAPLLDAAVSFLADLAQDAPVLEFGIGTGRLAVPLSRRGISVRGIELSQAMVDELGRQSQGNQIEVTIGDFATTTVDSRFRVVYLVRNTITNLITQAEQIRCFANAAAHLEQGGFFVIENYIPALRQLIRDDATHVFAATPDHVGIGEYDLAKQIETSRHWWTIDGELRTFDSQHRFVWPSELDLMAAMAGMRLHQRWGDWYRSPFTSASTSHISVWQVVL